MQDIENDKAASSEAVRWFAEQILAPVFHYQLGVPHVDDQSRRVSQRPPAALDLEDPARFTRELQRIQALKDQFVDFAPFVPKRVVPNPEEQPRPIDVPEGVVTRYQRRTNRTDGTATTSRERDEHQVRDGDDDDLQAAEIRRIQAEMQAANTEEARLARLEERERETNGYWAVP